MKEINYIAGDVVIMPLVVRDMKGTRYYIEQFYSNYTVYRLNTLLTKITPGYIIVSAITPNYSDHSRVLSVKQVAMNRQSKGCL